MTINGDIISEIESFMCLGFIVKKKSSDFNEDVKHKNKGGWVKWKESCGVLCDKRIPMRLKGKFYKSVVRPTMLHGSEFCETNQVIRKN
ncbi:Hypothetical protein CINCED_3A001717 [Cinara cedri]|uniref:Uncharacterized protein n=1 Tax=Cinara cedri TaxID=506608 RepID=A0A5E4M887_9HEMI|nr:Hypothetical protein CINCED_3A001717 [Cinara cedri]